MSHFISLEQLQQQPNESMLSVDLRLPPHINPELLEINSGRIEAVARCT